MDHIITENKQIANIQMKKTQEIRKEILKFVKKYSDI